MYSLIHQELAELTTSCFYFNTIFYQLLTAKFQFKNAFFL
jgi:hypothetical protein